MIQRIRFTFSQKEPYPRLRNILGFTPNDFRIYQLALRHSSSNNKFRNRLYNNERLEFLGDSILSSLVSDIIYHAYPNLREGDLTSLRSKMVQRATLDQLAIDIGLHTLIQSNENKQNIREGHISGNAFEALIGAIYLDKGYGKCKQFLQRLIDQKYLNMEKLSRSEINFKSRLIEWTQRKKLTYSFKHTAQNNPQNPHEPQFAASLYIQSVFVGSGIGRSKKEAEQQACRVAMAAIKRKKFKFPDTTNKPDAKSQSGEASSNS